MDRSYRFTGQWRAQRQRLLREQGGQCALCPAVNRPGAPLHQAHLVPYPIGDDTQTVLLCALCHRRFDAQRQRVHPGQATPGVMFAKVGDRQLSLRHEQTSAVLADSPGVGPGSPAFPPGYGGIWGDQEPFSSGSGEGAEGANTREITELPSGGISA